MASQSGFWMREDRARGHAFGADSREAWVVLKVYGAWLLGDPGVWMRGHLWTCTGLSSYKGCLAFRESEALHRKRVPCDDKRQPQFHRGQA